MWIFFIVVAVLGYFVLPDILRHREKMAQLKKDKENQ